jgi:Leucine-rich repeat (LRR) protein
VHIKNLDAIADNEFLAKIKGIDFRNDSLHDFHKEILQSMPNLRLLILFNTDLENIDDDLLDSSSPLGFEKLESLSIKRHKLVAIEDGTFAKLKVLKQLDLSNNNLEFIGMRSFSGLEKLESLNLNNNAINKLDQFVFAELPSLMELQMRYNKLNLMNLNVFHNNQNLKLLNVAGNKLERFDFDSENRADHELRQVFPNLENIDLSGNRWECAYLNGLVQEMEVASINLVFLTDYLKVRGTTNRHVKGVGCRNDVRKVPVRIATLESSTVKDDGIISKGNITTFVLRI